MQDSDYSNSRDEIDLREFFVTLWAYKFFICGVCILGIFCGGYYALNADKVYTSSAIFKFQSDDTNQIPRFGQMETFANLFGVAGGSKTSISVDQVMGRIFIQNVDRKLNFQTDPYFNTYDPNYVDPTWKALIKKIIGFKKIHINSKEATWQSIITNYSKNIKLEITQDNSIKIIVTHEDAARAAEIANIIMNEIITTAKKKHDAAQDKHLSYLSTTLAQALNELEMAQSNLKEFALENSALPLESFAAGSLQLDALREQLERTTNLHKAVTALYIILQNKATDQNSYLKLRQSFPIVDQVEFRRVLGQNEIISSWNWPEISSVEAVIDTLLDRKNRLQSQVDASQKDAERSGLALATFARLEREADIAEATYTILIEQVKAQSMLVGYRPDQSEVYEYASPSINASAPRRSLILALGAVLGLFLGIAISAVLARLRDVYYSKNSMISDAQARYISSVRTLIPFQGKSLKDINTMIVRNQNSVLRGLAMEIHKSNEKQVVISSSRAKILSSSLGKSLAIYMSSDNLKIALMNFSSHVEKIRTHDKGLSLGSFIVEENFGQVSVLKPFENLASIDLLSQKDFIKKTLSLNSTFDLVFLCADNDNAISLLSALEGQKSFHIAILKAKKTKSATISRMRALLPIKGLVYG